MEVLAADPLNLVGIIVPGQKVVSNSGKSIVFKGGVFLWKRSDEKVLLMSKELGPFANCQPGNYCLIYPVFPGIRQDFYMCSGY
ncbi:MAG: hypothetical protein K8F91_05975 [Candidatus Obscuribacterales bacterium]|nr:hypothetical protein [Candidatus Obscuribacterales bacterium]